MKRIIILLFIALHISCGKEPDQNIAGDKKEELILKELQHQLKKDLADDNIDGSLSATVVKDGKIIWSEGFGYANKEADIKSHAGTIYRVGSITKTFTAFLMMQLYEEGIIELNDTIEKYVPEVTQIKGYSEDTKFTFIQLASHTAGLSREPDMEEASTGPLQEWENKLSQALPTVTFIGKPNGEYAYSNVGYAILGLALSRASNQPYIELIKHKIFDPLKMNNSFFSVPENKWFQVAKGMEGGPFGELNTDIPKSEHSGRGYKVPNGAIYSTPNDLAKFMIAMMGYESLISRASLEKMSQPPLREEDDWWQSYGLGVRLLRDDIVSTAGHTGAVSGYTANFMYQREGGYGIVTMRNYNWGMTNIDLRSFAVLRRLKKIANEE
ncbi:MAG: serine hydrolase domain-containing protein [Bacteroidota bacterium]